MKVTVHSITDQAVSWHGNRNFGLNNTGYERAMEWLKKHQEWRGGERYEYFGTDMNIHFVWDMTDDEFKAFMAPDDEDLEDLRDYCGALFFGNFKLEFIKMEVGYYCNLFQYGAENEYGSAYAYLEDGTPYEELDEVDDIRIPRRRTFESFAENIERSVIDLLNKNPALIEDALEDTIPSKWYPTETYNYTKNFTREN